MPAFSLHNLMYGVGLAAVLCLSACQTTTTTLPRSGFEAADGHGNLVTRSSHFAFPSHVGPFRRAGSRQYDAAGEDVSVKYEAGHLIVVDVYDYPMERESIGAELRFRENEIKATHPDAKLISKKPVTIRPGGRVRRGEKAVFTFSQVFRADVRGPYKSQCLIFPRARRWIAYRATYTADHAARAEEEIDQFLNALAWPE